MIKLDDLIDYDEDKIKLPKYLSVRLDPGLESLLNQLRKTYGKRNAAEIMRRSLRAGASEAIERKPDKAS